MNLNFFTSKRYRQDAGIALLTTILLLFLMSSLLVGFAVLLLSNQQLAGANNDQVTAFYAAEAGMEQMTASLGALFSQTYSPSILQINALQTTPPSSAIFPGVIYMTADGNPGYTITPLALDKYGNPAPTITTIKAGAYQGMTAMATEYTLSVNARTSTGREVNLVRTTQTVGIPMFQFGIFADTDLDFFPGPTFNFGGRTHTNGNLWLAGQSTLTLSDKVDAYKDILRTRLENGFATAGVYTGTVNITTSPGTSNVRSLAMSEGSLTGTVPPYDTPVFNTNWQTISQTYYNSDLRNGQGSAFPLKSTGASKLNLGVVTIGKGATQAIDIIRRPAPGESASITNERYFAQASLRILLSDNPADIMNLPCVDQGTQPFDLSYLASDPGAGAVNWLASTYVPLVALATKLNANGVVALPLAASGAGSSTVYNAGDGYWMPPPSAAPASSRYFSTIRGFIKIEAQLAPYPTACTTASQKDVTIEVLGLGYVGRNLNPVPQSYNGTSVAAQWVQPTAGVAVPLPAGLPSFTLPYQNGATTTKATTAFYPDPSATYPGTCPDPHPNAVIRLERVRDNPSTIPWTDQTVSHPGAPLRATMVQACGYDWSLNTYAASAHLPTDFWPNTLFDSREGTLREASMSAANLPTLNGTMHYIELDAHNVARWFGGQIGSTGTSTKDSVVSPDNYVIYISDRRGNYDNGLSLGAWPPVSFTGLETGEYGWNDLVNSITSPTSGCPNATLDTGEDVDTTGALYTYGANASYQHALGNGTTTSTTTTLSNGQYGFFKTLAGTGVVNTSVCTAVPSYSNSDNIWPMMVAANSNAARENPPLFFRRAVKIVNGSDLTPVGTCPSGVSCGLAIATENPAYVQGDFNANLAGAGWGSAEVATSIAADAVTLLSIQWNDLNSFITPYDTGSRNGATTWYRTAIVAGATLPFAQPAGTGQDYGTDGGVHNFLRYIEAWGGTLNYNGSIVDLYTSRQANGTFKCCGVVYSPPTRGYNFDSNFLNPTLLPPRTPLFRDVNTTGWLRVLAPQANSYK
jgi:hypothetical protein